MNDPTDNEPDLTDIPEFSTGIAADGTVLLMNGLPLTIEEVLERLRRGARAERLAYLLARTTQKP